MNHHLGGDPNALAAIDVRFVRPLHLPADVGVYIGAKTDSEGHIEIALGKGPGETAYMLGTAEIRS